MAIGLTKDQVAMEPGFITKAPDAPGSEGSAPLSGSTTDPNAGAGKTGTEPTLDLGGKPVTPPSTSRRTQ